MSSTNASRIKVYSSNGDVRLNYLVSQYLVNYEGKCRGGVAAYSKLILAEVKRLSNTRHVSLLELKAMGHPYSKNYPNNTKSGVRYKFPPSVVTDEPEVVNKQSGNFYRGWHIRSTGKSEDGDGYSVYNDSKQASAFEGKSRKNSKSRMVSRPTIQKAIKNVRAKEGTLKQFCELFAMERSERVALAIKKMVPIPVMTQTPSFLPEWMKGESDYAPIGKTIRLKDT